MFLYGASGHAKVIIDILKSLDIPVKRIFDDNPSIKQLFGIQVEQYESQVLGAPLLISIGNNSHRARVAKKLQVEFGSATHPSAIISSSVFVESGSVIMQGAILQAEVQIGKHVIINTAASVDHECVISDFVHISPNAVLSGNVQVGEGTHIGAGAVIIPGVKIGKWCTVGAGSVVIRDIPDYATVVGNPARLIKYTANEK